MFKEACVSKSEDQRVLGSTRKIVKKLCYSQSVVNLRENETKFRGNCGSRRRKTSAGRSNFRLDERSGDQSS